MYVMDVMYSMLLYSLILYVQCYDSVSNIYSFNPIMIYRVHGKMGTGKKGTGKKGTEKRAQEKWAQEKKAQVKN